MIRLLGTILAGGKASRFGSDKAMALHDGRPLVAHAAAALRPWVGATVLCGGHPRLAGVPVLADRPHPGLGPLGGLNAALHHAATEGYDAILSIGCDTPSMPPDLVPRLMAAGGAAFVEHLPLIGLWPAALAAALDAFILHDPRRSIRGFALSAGATGVAAGPIANVNTPADLAALGGTG